MYKVKVDDEIFFAEKGELLSDILIKNGKKTEHPCGGKGICKKCKVLIDGNVELSCRYTVNSDISVSFINENEIVSETGAETDGKFTDNMCLCLDIGTTTLALALVSLDEKKIADVRTSTNPQRVFGADIMSRIDYCRKNGVSDLHSSLIEKINEMISDFSLEHSLDMYVSANVTMLHTFFNADCSSMGASPYVPQFLDSKKQNGKSLGLKFVDKVISLPSIHSFVGADIVAGMNFIGMPKNEKYNLLVDLGTNAEIVLYSEKSAVCTSAAAGPCFEGVNISCGMSATDGAVYEFDRKNGMVCVKTINKKMPRGICGTGLIDIMAELMNGEIDETGFMECETFEIFKDIYVSQADVRQFQLAKSAVYSGILTLISREKITFEQIEKMYISGGFSSKMNMENAVKVGLLPKELKEKSVLLNNSSLLGTVKFACENNDLKNYIDNAEYIDLSADPGFSELFVDNMVF